jgi:hypothetical protein
MSTTPASPTPPTGAKAPTEGDREIKIVQHSQLFYWWPVWAVGFLMAIISFFGGHRLAVLPSETVVSQESEKEHVLRVPGTPPKPLPTDADKRAQAVHLRDSGSPFRLHMSPSQFPGVIWAITLLLVIVITNVPLRGMWSVVVIVSFVLFSIIFYLAGIWTYVVDFFEFLDIRINAGGYVFISLVLFVMWFVTVFFFDKQIYMIFTPGMLKVREEIGGGETAYDTRGMVVQHLRDDLFRHWILGLGSGDLVVRTSGAHSHEFRLSNVLFVGRKLQVIEEMQRDVPVVAG